MSNSASTFRPLLESCPLTSHWSEEVTWSSQRPGAGRCTQLVAMVWMYNFITGEWRNMINNLFPGYRLLCYRYFMWLTLNLDLFPLLHLHPTTRQGSTSVSLVVFRSRTPCSSSGAWRAGTGCSIQSNMACKLNAIFIMNTTAVFYCRSHPANPFAFPNMPHICFP